MEDRKSCVGRTIKDCVRASEGDGAWMPHNYRPKCKWVSKDGHTLISKVNHCQAQNYPAVKAYKKAISEKTAHNQKVDT